MDVRSPRPFSRRASSAESSRSNVSPLMTTRSILVSLPPDPVPAPLASVGVRAPQAAQSAARRRHGGGQGRPVPHQVEPAVSHATSSSVQVTGRSARCSRLSPWSRGAKCRSSERASIGVRSGRAPSQWPSRPTTRSAGTPARRNDSAEVASCRFASRSPSRPRTSGTCHQRGASSPRRSVQDHLPRRGRQQVVPADDVGDALAGIVNHDRKLVARKPLLGPDDEVAHLVRGPKHRRSREAIDDANGAGRHDQPVVHRTLVEAPALGVGGSQRCRIRHLSIADVRRGSGAPQLRPAQAAGVHQSARGERAHRGAVRLEVVRLPSRVAVVVDAQPRERVQYGLNVGARTRGASRSSMRSRSRQPRARARSQFSRNVRRFPR